LCFPHIMRWARYTGFLWVKLGDTEMCINKPLTWFEQ
jgi:hypothetical protein